MRCPNCLKNRAYHRKTTNDFRCRDCGEIFVMNKNGARPVMVSAGTQTPIQLPDGTKGFMTTSSVAIEVEPIPFKLKVNKVVRKRKWWNPFTW